MQRGQVSLEYAAVVALVLAASIPMWLFVQSEVSRATWELDSALASSAASTIAQSADWAYLQGYPAQAIVSVTLPSSVTNVSFRGREVRIGFSGPSGGLEAYAVCAANLSGFVPASSGKLMILVNASASTPDEVGVWVAG